VCSVSSVGKVSRVGFGVRSFRVMVSANIRSEI